MVATAAEVQRLLTDTILSGREAREIPVATTDEIALKLAIDDGEPMEAWRVGRRLVGRTGRWPVLTQKAGPDLFSRWLYAPTGDQSPQAIVTRAERLAWPQDREQRQPIPQDRWKFWVANEVQRTERRCGSAPTAQEVIDRFPRADWRALDRHLLDWEEVRRPTTGPEPPSERIAQFTLGEARHLLLLPTARPWQLPAYIHYWGAGAHQYAKPERLIAAMASWHRRYSAEPFATTNVTVAFAVGRPPTDLLDALALAKEHESFSKADDAGRGLARALFRSDRWELFDRP